VSVRSVVILSGQGYDERVANSDNMHPVRQARERLGRQREWLAFRAGVTVRTVERIEAGDVDPHRVTKRAIAEALGVAPSALGWPDADLEPAA